LLTHDRGSLLRHFAALHPISSFACAALASVLFHPASVSAVALGNVTLQSSLGQPLRIVIPVALNDDETLNASCLKLVRDPAPGAPQLLTGRFSVEHNSASTRLIVTTFRAVEEPALRLSVEAGCGDTTRRDYVLLLDPQGVGLGTRAASADVDEFRNYIGAARPVPNSRAAQRVATSARTIVVDIAPARTSFIPIDPPPFATSRIEKAVTAVPVSVPAPVAVLPEPSLEPMLPGSIPPQIGFIPEAAAASLSRVSADTRDTITASNRAALPGAHVDAADETLWTQTWPYGAVLISMGAIALTAFAKRRGIVPAWSAPDIDSLSKTPMQNTVYAEEFADFTTLIEHAPITVRAISRYERNEAPAYDAKLDTLLHASEARSDGIDEHAIRQAWAELDTETAVDIGTDSILKAIANAEREMRISPPEPTQAAMDQALDDDLMNPVKLKG
jgi:hypothetical protein